MRPHLRPGLSASTSCATEDSATVPARTEAPPGLAPATKVDLVAAVRHLTGLCSDYLVGGSRLGVEPTTERLLLVIDTALALAGTESAEIPPLAADDVEGFFLRGLLDELRQQPSNLFTGTRLLNGEEVPVPIDTAGWRECLRVFRAAVLRGDVTVGGKRQPARYLGASRPGHLFVPSESCDAASLTLSASSDSGVDTEAGQLAALKRWTRELLGLADSAMVTFHEFACRDVGCLRAETVVCVFAEGANMRWKIERRGNAPLTRDYLARALARPPLA